MQCTSNMNMAETSLINERLQCIKKCFSSEDRNNNLRNIKLKHVHVYSVNHHKTQSICNRMRVKQI